MIWYFQKGLRYSILAKRKQRGRELDSFEELVKKAKNAEAKVALQSYIYAQDTD